MYLLTTILYLQTSVSFLTKTHRPSLPSDLICPRLTIGIHSTRVGVAQVCTGEGSAGVEWVPSVAFRTGADSLVSCSLTDSTLTTGRPACLYIISAGVHTPTRTTLALLGERTVR